MTKLSEPITLVLKVHLKDGTDKAVYGTIRDFEEREEYYITGEQADKIMEMSNRCFLPKQKIGKKEAKK